MWCQTSWDFWVMQSCNCSCAADSWNHSCWSLWKQLVWLHVMSKPFLLNYWPVEPERGLLTLPVWNGSNMKDGWSWRVCSFTQFTPCWWCVPTFLQWGLFLVNLYGHSVSLSPFNKRRRVENDFVGCFWPKPSTVYSNPRQVVSMATPESDQSKFTHFLYQQSLTVSVQAQTGHLSYI